MGKNKKTDVSLPAPLEDKIWRYFPWAVFILALAARLIVLWQLSGNYPGFDEPSVDSRWHLLWARQIAAGDWLGHGVFYRAPLYPYLLATIISVLGDNLWLIRIIQALIGSATAVLVYLLGRRVFDRRIGAAASIIWALWATAIYYESEFLIPVLIIPLNLWALYRLAGCVTDRRLNIRSALFTGLILGVSAIARPNILIFVVALIVWIFWRFPLHAGGKRNLWIPVCALLAGLSLPIAVVTVRNAVVGDDFVPISYQGGVNLYLGNNPAAEGLTMMMPDIRLDETIDWTEFVRTTDSLAMAQAGKQLKPSEISNFWMKKTIDSVLAHPGAEIGLLGKKLFYFWNGFENGDNTDIYRHVDYSILLRVGVWHWLIWFPFGLISALGLWGMWASRREGRHVELLNVFVLVYMLSVVGFLVTARHRLPVVPIIIVFAMVGIARLKDVVASNVPLLKKLGSAAIVGLLLVITNLSLFDVGLSNPIQFNYQLGLVYDRKGEYTRAIRAYEKALAIWPNHFPSRHNLAYDLYLQGDYQDAIRNFTWALGARPDDPEALNNLGLAYRAAGDTTSALGVFRIASRKNPRLIEAQLNIGDTYRASRKFAEAEKAYIAAIRIDSTFGPALNNLGLLYIDTRRLDKAEELLQWGTHSAPNYPFCWLNLGALYLETNRPAQAIQPLQRFLEQRPQQMEARFNLAVAYRRTGRVEAAKRQLEGILRQNPQHPQARALMERIINQGR